MAEIAKVVVQARAPAPVRAAYNGGKKLCFARRTTVGGEDSRLSNGKVLRPQHAYVVTRIEEAVTDLNTGQLLKPSQAILYNPWGQEFETAIPFADIVTGDCFFMH